jgi:hypothetical protein
MVFVVLPISQQQFIELMAKRSYQCVFFKTSSLSFSSEAEVVSLEL